MAPRRFASALTLTDGSAGFRDDEWLMYALAYEIENLDGTVEPSDGYETFRAILGIKLYPKPVCEDPTREPQVISDWYQKFSDDEYLIRRRAEVGTDEELMAEYRNYERKVWKKLNDDAGLWSQIERVAEALWEFDKLTAEQVEELL